MIEIQPAKLPKRTRMINYAIYALLVLLTIILAVVIFWLLYPYKTTHVEEPIKILNENKQVAIGGQIIQQLNIDKPDGLAPENPTRVLICNDGNLVTLSALPSTLNLPIGKYTLVNDLYTLPPKVSIGSQCYFIWRQEYKVNPIRVISAEWKSESFQVIKAEE